MTSALALALAKFWNLVSQPHKTFPKKRTECVLQTVVRAVGSASFFSLWEGPPSTKETKCISVMYDACR